MRTSIFRMRWLVVFFVGTVLLAAGIGWYLYRPKETAPYQKSPESSKVVATYRNTFETTVYYTPRESGFTESGGFDTRLETRPGLNGRKFPRDFLKAVEMEGFGRIEHPENGKHYISYYGGKWRFAEEPLDANGKPLEPRESAAIKNGHRELKRGAEFKLEFENIGGAIERETWKVTDTGSGLQETQIDLYWGEADPKGPGRLIMIPDNAPTNIQDPTVKVLE